MAIDIDNIVYKYISLAAKCIVPETIDNGIISNRRAYENNGQDDYYSLQEPYRFYDMNITCDSDYAANGQPLCQPDHTWHPEPGCSRGSYHVFYSGQLF